MFFTDAIKYYHEIQLPRTTHVYLIVLGVRSPKIKVLARQGKNIFLFKILETFCKLQRMVSPTRPLQSLHLCLSMILPSLTLAISPDTLL